MLAAGIASTSRTMTPVATVGSGCPETNRAQRSPTTAGAPWRSRRGGRGSGAGGGAGAGEHAADGRTVALAAGGAGLGSGREAVAGESDDCGQQGKGDEDSDRDSAGRAQAH